MLGLGDIIIPALSAALMWRFDLAAGAWRCLPPPTPPSSWMRAPSSREGWGRGGVRSLSAWQSHAPGEEASERRHIPDILYSGALRCSWASHLRSLVVTPCL
jgi:hypothetical protein